MAWSLQLRVAKLLFTGETYNPELKCDVRKMPPRSSMWIVRYLEARTSLEDYVEPEAKMKNEGLMSTKIRSFKYGEGVLARSATKRPSWTYSKARTQVLEVEQELWNAKRKL